MHYFLRSGFLTALAFVLNLAAICQVNPLGPSQHLAGFNYREKVENADPDAKGLPLVIAIHWSGSTPDEFAPFVSGFSKPVRILLLEGSYAHPRKGRTFYVRSPKDYYNDMSADEKMVHLLKEAEKLGNFIKVATERYSPRKKPVVIGASQGGDLSYVTAIRYGSLISASLPLLATMDERIISDKATQRKSAPIDAYHGDKDPIVPVATAERHIKALKLAGYKATLHAYPDVTHDIPPTMKSDYIKRIEKTLF